MFKRLQETGIKRHFEKCELMKESVKYLGHGIDKHGLYPFQTKIRAFVNALDPKNVDELCPFSYLITYYAKFPSNMVTFLTPLYIIQAI